MTGLIFDIKGFSVNDGDGARTTVFFKGCPLRCVWCHNPEGLSANPQLVIKKSMCKNCGACSKKCNHSECQKWNTCLYACPENLITVCGYEITEAELAKKLLKNKAFLTSSGGGITFSGGEPLMQSEFIISLIPLLEGMNTAIETSGYASESVFRKTAAEVNTVMIDIKLADNNEHVQYTGVENTVILKNLKWMQENEINHIIRVPLIPHITDTYENLSAISELAGDGKIELLPYNSLAGSKYDSVGMKYNLPSNSNKRITPNEAVKLFKNASVK